MSHYHERKEKICLNCGSALSGRYCHSCGQENIEPKETFLGLVTHFFYDITHFDGKFFSTVRLLLTRPGYLSKEYTSGRRVSYLHPIRMYVFTSALFFLIFFSVVHIGGSSEASETVASDSSSAELARVRASVLRKATSKDDSVQLNRVMDMLGDEAVNIRVDSVRKRPGRRPFIKILNNDTDFETAIAYDSMQKLLPAGERDGWFKRMTTRKQIELNQKLQKDPRGFFKVWIDKLLHQFPQLLFLSLPFFALILQLLYLRRRYYYSDHAIFTIHLYIFTFISLLISLFFVKLQNLLKWDWLSIINPIITLYILFYTYKAMRNFYGQGRFKTFVKYFLLSFLSLFVILFLSVIFFMLSIIQL